MNDRKKPFDRTSWHDLRNKDGDEQEADDCCRNRSHLGANFEKGHAALLLRRGSVLAQFCLFPNKLRPPFRLAATISSFADHFTTRELNFTRATGEDLTLTHQLCINKSDGTPVCLTGDQLGALLSHTSNDNTPTSVSSSASNIREPEASTTPRDLTNSEQPDNANWTPDSVASTTPPAANDNPSPGEASPTSQGTSY